MPRIHRSFEIPESFSTTPPLFSPATPWLAPLAGYSDLPFRLLCRQYGAAVCETEMISAKGLVYRSQRTASLLQATPEDAPLVVQLFGGEPESMAQALLELRQHGYIYFDCNMGCPVRKVMRQNAGAALLADHRLALAIARAMLAAARVELPGRPTARIGFKLRLGPDAAHSAIALGRALVDAGASWLCLHPRTAAEGFGGQSHWQEIAELTQAVSVPVIASGDLMEAEDGMECLTRTGAATVMYARGALRNPFIFRQHLALVANSEAPQADHADVLAMIRSHIQFVRTTYGNDQAFRKIRSIIPRYARKLAGVNTLRQALCACENWDALEQALLRFWQRGENSR